MKEDRLDRIERAIEANARSIGALAHSLKNVTNPVQGDPIDHLQDRMDSLESTVYELSNVLNSYPNRSAIGYIARMVKEMVFLLNYEIFSFKEVESQFGPPMHPHLDQYLGCMIEDSKPHPENRIDEFDRRLKAIEEKLSRLDT